MPFTRKMFLGTTAAAAAAVLSARQSAAAEEEVSLSGAPARTPIHFHVLKSDEYDRAGMMATLSVDNPHKQVFESVSPLLVAPGVASVYIHMQNAMNAYEFSFGNGKLSTLAVLIGPSIVFALNDAAWQKYHIGGALNLDATNTYYRADSNLDLSATPDDPDGIYQDWSGQAVLKRGGKFMVCHNATTAVAGLFASKLGLKPQDVLADFKRNMLPGFMLVPAGVGAVQLAQENGWKLYTII